MHRAGICEHYNHDICIGHRYVNTDDICRGLGYVNTDPDICVELVYVNTTIMISV
jgi:hypothetical protein